MAEYDADVIVIGSGSLGSLAALQIARAGKDVLILEAGPETPDWKLTENLRTSPRKNNSHAPFADLPYAPNSFSPGYIDADTGGGKIPGTVRSAGGTSRHWNGLAWRLLPEEMKMRSTFGISRDWPFDYDELEPFYTQAEYQVGVSGSDETDYSGRDRGSAYPPRSKPYPVPPEPKPYALQRFEMRAGERGYFLDHAPSARLSEPYRGRPACIGNNTCNPHCPIGAKHSGTDALNDARQAGARLRTGAIVDKLEKDGQGRITAVSFLDPEGNRTTLSAKTFIIAAHAFETPKLLLMNELANGSGMVGRNLMMHPTLHMGLFADEPLWIGRGQYLQGANLQQRLRDDRGEASASYYTLENQSAGLPMAKALLEAGGRIGKDLDDEFRDRASRYILFQLLLEDLPEAENVVTLNPSFRDALGQPGLKVRYRLQDYVKRALPRTLDDYANWLQAMNGVVHDVPGATWTNQDHIMGTTIMGDDPADSVVDGDLRCHEHENLYLVTTGVFPSASCVNPTLTGMALAVRAGQHIAQEV